ncbi:MAG TPA: FtsX-like permease family protein [Planctomycetota bacterium]|nr:FtsX-like permease family protein [Planctomycetota bacterium]
MSTLVSLASLRGLARHPWQIALSVLGIALGVAVVVGIDLASASSLRGFRLSTEALVGTATHEVRGGPGGLPEAIFAKLQLALPDVPLAPVVDAQALVLDDEGRGKDGAKRTVWTVFGVDAFSEAALRPWLGDLRSAGGENDSLELLSVPGAALLSDASARACGIRAGDTVRLRVGTNVGSVRVIGTIVAESPRAKLALDGVLVVDVATAQELRHAPGVLTHVDLALPQGRPGEAAAERIRALLPPGATLSPAAARGRGMEEMTDAFRLNLRALSLLALLVGVFLVYNTMTFSVVQRRGLIATLRTLGVTRTEIFRTIAGEALWLGVLGTALGLALGAVLARGLLVLVSRTMNDLYFVVSVQEVHVDGSLLLRAAVLGVGATFFGAFGPAYEATRERPRLALAASFQESRWSALLPRFAAGGAACLATALALFFVRGDSLVPSFVGLLFLLLGAGLLTPTLTVACARAATPGFSRALGLFGRHAARGIETHLSRTSVAIAALAVAVSATIGMGVMVDSFRSTFVKWLTQSFEADVYATAPTLVGSHNDSTLDPALIELFRGAPGVEEVVVYRGFETALDGRPVHGETVGTNRKIRRAFDFLDARAEEVWPAFENEDGVIVSEAFGYHNHVARGDKLTLSTDRGPREFEVAATRKDFASDRGFVLMARATYERWYDDRGVTSLDIFAAPGVDGEELAGTLRALVPQDQEVIVRSNRALRETSLVVFDRTFEVTSVLRLLATFVAFVGVVSALLSLEMERAREIAVLRAQGVTPREIRRLVIAETGLIGAIAGLIAIPLGMALALVLIFVINKRSFGWSLDLAVDPWLFVSALGLTVGAALLAGAWPAWRMSRMRPALALRGE